MRTRYIPAGIMLTAGVVTCIISIIQQQDIIKSLTTLLIVLVLFYVIGLVAKFFVEKILRDFSEKKMLEDIKNDAHEENEEESLEVDSQDV